MEALRSTAEGRSNSQSVASNKEISNSGSMMLFTKFMMPIIPLDYISRVHLIDKLNEITEKKLTLISAPAGYGKTTLLSMWFNKKGTSIHTAWISLDEKDNDLNIFWKYIIMAIERSTSVDISNYESLECSKLEYPVDILINDLINRLSSINKTIALVIDDYHFISEESIHEAMQYFINRLPLNVHVVITSRVAPTLKLARLRSHGDLLELKTEDLKLDNEETSEFLNGLMKLCMERDEIDKLKDWTEGWFAVLNLIAIAIKNGTDNRKYLGDSIHISDHVVEYLSEEVFYFLDSATKDFLLKTSILDILSVDLCNAVVGINNSGEIISRLERSNVFINALDIEKKSYKYHSLFKIFLNKKLSESCYEIINELHSKASRWYEDNHMLQKALDHSVAANNFENTARLIEKYGEVMIINRDLSRVADIIETLPKYLIAGSSKICALFTTAVAGKNGSGKNGIFIGELFVSFDDSIFRESQGDLLLIKTTLAYSNEDFRTALAYGVKLLDDSNAGNVLQCLLYKILIQIYYVTGVSSKAESCLESYIAALKNKNYFDEFFINLTYNHFMVHILCGIGKYKQAFVLLKGFMQKLNDDNMYLPAATNSIYLDLGYLHYEFGEIESSMNSIKKCIEISSIKMDSCRLISGYILLARVNGNIGNYPEMMKYMTMVDELCSKYNARFMIVNMSAYIVRTLLAAEEIEYAEYYMRKYKICIQDDYDVLYEEAHLALADLHIAKGELSIAEELLNRLYDEVIKSERTLSYIRVMILKSLLEKYKGNDSNSLANMKAAIELGSEQGYIATFADFGKPAADIICKLIKRKEDLGAVDEKDINYAACILTHIKEPQHHMLKAGLGLVKDLSKRELEVLQCLLKGLTNKEIASILFIEECTVKKHINKIYTKIGAVNREQAVELCTILKQ